MFSLKGVCKCKGLNWFYEWISRGKVVGNPSFFKAKIMKEITAIQQDIISSISKELISKIKLSLKRDEEFFSQIIRTTIGSVLWEDLEKVLVFFNEKGSVKKRFKLSFSQPLESLRIKFIKLNDELDEVYFS